MDISRAPERTKETLVSNIIGISSDGPSDQWGAKFIKPTSGGSTPDLAAPSGTLSTGDVFGDSERNWSEDFSSENGNYSHVCRDCGQSFVGHKRRPPQCKKCAAVAKARWDALTPAQQIEDCAAWLRTLSPNSDSQTPRRLSNPASP